MPKNASRRDGVNSTYRLEIGAFSPETIPMARLSEYMRAFAKMLGEGAYVHFSGVSSGSTALDSFVQPEAVVKVYARLSAVRVGDGPPDARDAEREINRLLREDNASAVLRHRKGDPKILEFPGIAGAKQEYLGIKQPGEVTGRVTRVGGTSEPFPLILEIHGRPVSGFQVDREMAKRLGGLLFEPIRVYGVGTWERDAEGEWTIRNFRVTDFEQLEDESLSEALADLRRLANPYPKDAYAELLSFREDGDEW